MLKALTSAALLAVSAQAQVKYPGDNCCDFYKDANMGGSKLHLCTFKTTDTTWATGDYGFHDNISSYWCGASVSWNLCNNSSGDCTYGNGDSGAGHIKVGQVGHNDAYDRVKMREYDPTAIGAVTVFQDANCVSYSGRFDAAANPSETAYYNCDWINKNNMGNDKISSVMVPQGYAVALYKDDGWSPNSPLIINGKTWNTSNYEMTC